jgi:hypothetical protein
MPAQVAGSSSDAGYLIDDWPCFNTGTYNSSYCPLTGNIPTANTNLTGLAMGWPGYSIQWKGDPGGGDPPCFYTTPPSLNSYGLPPFCQQIVNFWEDDTSDTTDELYQTIVVTQGTTDILDTGVIDWGTNGGGPSQNVEWIDVLFGTLGQTPGKNVGMCLPANSLIISNEFGANFASGKTCQNPILGPATVTITTYIGTPESKGKPGAAVKKCGASGTAACSISQKFTIYFTDDALTYF